MNRKGLIIVTLLFMLIVGALLFFTIANMGEEELEVRMSITSATAAQESPIYLKENVQNDEVVHSIPSCRC